MAKTTVTYSRTGRYPEMESKLIDWIREVREQDFIVETWMLVIEGRKLLEALYAVDKFSIIFRWTTKDVSMQSVID